MNYFSSNLKKLGRKSSSSISEWEQGKYSPKAGTLSDIATLFSVTLSDLMERDLSNELPSNLIEFKPNFIKLPILGPIACGDPILAEENIEGYIYEIADGLPSGKLAVLIAKGNSMEPTIPNGATVIIREQPDVENGEIAAVLLNENTEATLKRVKKQDGIIMLMPDNPEYDPIIITDNNPARIIGKAVRVTRDLI